MQIGQRGFGINSPYLLKNMQFGIGAEAGRQLKVGVEVAEDLAYEICLVPNPLKAAGLSKLNLENIINNSLLSGEKHGPGSFSIETTTSDYILLINAFT